MAKLSAITITIISTLIIALFFVISSSARFVDDDGGIKLRRSSNQREFDYFVLALQWPGTYCRRTQKCCKTNGCCRSSGPPQHFTIHGLWADYNDGSWPSCCSNDSFDTNEISTLEKALYEYWPTLSCGSTSTCHGHKGSFYAHEEVLNEAGYVPSNSEKYPLGGVITAIENAFHTSPLISCSKGAIQEIHLCFYKDFKPRDCVATSGVKSEVNLSKSSCPKYVSLPEYVSSGELINGKTFSQSLPDVASQ
ncbi:hypothetical protein KSS87_014987 [Heliosperma pusillum]|nr:hypothetical protein KSS87_014987 [Heliosperma pusillum]